MREHERPLVLLSGIVLGLLWGIVLGVILALASLNEPPMYPPVHPCVIVGAFTEPNGALVLIRECNDGSLVREYPWPKEE